MSEETIEKTKGIFGQLTMGGKHLITGEMLQEFMGKHRRFITVCVLLGILYVFVGYACNRQIADIAQLEKDQKVAYYTDMTLRTELTTVSRQSHLQEALLKRHSRLKESNVPAIKL